MRRDSPGFDSSLPSAANDGEATRAYLNRAAPSPVRPAIVPVAESVGGRGERAAYVTVTLEGSGQGSASQKVNSEVLGPDFTAASTVAVIPC
jgi:hypothetical protein